MSMMMTRTYLKFALEDAREDNFYEHGVIVGHDWDD